MTEQELDALPEVGGFGERHEIRGGRRITIPVHENAGAVFMSETDEVFTDRQGRHWMIVTHNGVRSKRRC